VLLCLSDVDEDDIPITSLHLKLTPKEFEASGWSARQLGFVQAVYNAQQLRYDPPEYDLMEDSMLRLQEYTGITNEEIQNSSRRTWCVMIRTTPPVVFCACEWSPRYR